MRLRVMVAGLLVCLWAGSVHAQSDLPSFMRGWAQTKTSGVPAWGADRNGDGVVDFRDSQKAIEDLLRGPPVTADNVEVLPSDGTVTVTPESATSFRLGGAVPALEPGDVIVSAAGHGLLRKVVSVTPDGGETVVETEDVGLAQIVESGSFFMEIPPPESAPILWDPEARPGGVQTSDASDGIPLGGIYLYGDSTSSSSVRIVAGSLKFKPTTSVGARFGWFCLEEFHATATGALDLDATVRFESTGALKTEDHKTLGVVPLGVYGGFIGPVPVVVAPRIEFTAGYEIGVTGQFAVETKCTANFAATIGETYVRGRTPEWAPTPPAPPPTGNVVVQHIDLGANAWAKLWVKAKLVLYLYGAVGPGIDVQLYRKANMTVDVIGNTYELVDLAGLQSDFSINMNILDLYQTTWSQTIFALGPFDLGRYSGSLGGTPAPTVDISADQTTIPIGGSTTLRWSSSNATGVVTSSFGTIELNGAKEVSPTETTTYSITVEGPGGQVSDQVEVIVTDDVPGPSVAIAADKTLLAPGESTTIRWASVNATNVVNSNFGATTLTGAKQVSPTMNTPYTIVVRGPTGQAEDTVLVRMIAGGDEEIGPDGAVYVWVPPGEFMMGSEDSHSDERPVHLVRITKGFWLHKCEVTNQQYAQFLNEHGSNSDGQGHKLLHVQYDWCRIHFTAGAYVPKAGWEQHPVIYVSWYGAKAYCDHYGLRLPTEAEWEYAAGGPEARKYPWGDEWDASKCCCWENHGPGYPGAAGTMEVGSLPVGNSWCSAMDMAGNVYEWCADWYRSDYYGMSPMHDPTGPASGDYRLLRGGLWSRYWLDCRCAYRGRLNPEFTFGGVGFRASRSP